MENYSNEQLCYLAAEGNTSARDVLWARVHGLYRHICAGLFHRHSQRATACGMAFDDFCSVGWFAFLDAVTDYAKETEREYLFINFARLHIKRHIFALLGLQTSKREPLNEASPLDAPISPDDGTMSLGDTLICPEAERPFADVEDSAVAMCVLERVAMLPQREQAIIRRHYWESTTFTEIAADFGVKPQRVHEIYKSALRKLRKDAHIQKIHREFYASYNFHKSTGYTAFRENQMSAVEKAVLYLEEKYGYMGGGGSHVPSEGRP